MSLWLSIPKTFFPQQVITFVDVLFRHTPARHVLVAVPKNVIVNWQREFDKWLPHDPTLLSNHSRQFQVKHHFLLLFCHCFTRHRYTHLTITHERHNSAWTLLESVLTSMITAFVLISCRWRRTDKGVLLVNYEMLRRLIATAKKSKTENSHDNIVTLEPSDDEIAGGGLRQSFQ